MSALWKTRFFRTVLPGRTASHKLRDYLPTTCDRHMHFNSWHTLHHPRLCKTPNWWAVLSAVSLNGKDNTSSPKLPLQHLGRFHGAGRSMKIPCNKNNASVFPIIDKDHLILLKKTYFFPANLSFQNVWRRGPNGDFYISFGKISSQRYVTITDVLTKTSCFSKILHNENRQMWLPTMLVSKVLSKLTKAYFTLS